MMKGVVDVQLCVAILGVIVVTTSVCAIAVRFSADHKAREEALYQQALAERRSCLEIGANASAAA